MTKITKKFLCLLAIASFALFAIACSPSYSSEGSVDLAVPEENTEQEIRDKEANPIEVETPFCNVYYPADKDGLLKAEVLGEGLDTSVSFYVKADGEKIPLYVLHFGSGEGLPVGSFEAEGGYSFDVTLELVDFESMTNLAEEDIETFAALQEGSNYLVERLSEDESFTPAL